MMTRLVSAKIRAVFDQLTAELLRLRVDALAFQRERRARGDAVAAACAEPSIDVYAALIAA